MDFEITSLVPREIATRQTLGFLKAHVVQPARILEIGCGYGDLAKALMNHGHSVVAIDTTAIAVTTARKIGVHAIHTDILAFQDEGLFDVVLFSRSLHHIHPLSEAVKKAKSLLKRGGRLLVEDFSVERVDEKTAAWFYGVSDHVDDLLGDRPSRETGMGALARWRRKHAKEPAVHSGGDILGEIASHFSHVKNNTCSYLYRSFVSDAERLEPGEETSPILRGEVAGIEAGLILPIGLRIVARA